MIETKIRVGTVDYPVSKQKVFKDVDMVELSDGQAMPPKAKTARRWKGEAPEHVAFSIQLPRYLFDPPPEGTPLPGDPSAYGAFKTTKENIGLWNKAIDFADAMNANTLVLITPGNFTPAKHNRDALKSFFETVDLGKRRVAWEHHGPWDFDDALQFAQSAGVSLALDPLRDPPPEGDFAYFRLGPFAAMGSRVGVYDLERLADLTEMFKEVMCVFDTPRSLDDARNLKKVLGGAELDFDL